MTANKFLIGLVITAILLICMPASASGEYTLGIFGNANEDDNINMEDVTYTERIILEYQDGTQLADAKYDGEIDILDITQIELIIFGKEKELTFREGPYHLSADRVVTVNKPVEKIILLYPGIGAAIRSAGAEDRVVAVCTWMEDKATFYPKLSKLPSVGHCRDPDYETILELEPSIVFSDPYGVGPIEKKLEKLDIPFARLDIYTPGILSVEIKKLGYILDTRDEAEEFADWYDGIMNTIVERVEGLSEEEKTRSYITMYSPDPPYGKCERAYMEMSELPGSSNIAIDMPGDYFSVDPEWVMEQNPSYIITRISCSPRVSGYDVDDESGIKAIRESIMRRSGWENIDAVKNEKVYITPIEIIGPGHFICVAYLAKCFHPELFEDLDPQAIHQEWLDRFQHLDYNVYERGVFWYPPLENG